MGFLKKKMNAFLVSYAKDQIVANLSFVEGDSFVYRHIPSGV